MADLAGHVKIVHVVDKVGSSIQVMCVVNDVDMTADIIRGIVIVVFVVWIVQGRSEGYHRFVIIVWIGIVRNDREALLRFVLTEFGVKSRGFDGSRSTGARSLLFSGALLPF